MNPRTKRNTIIAVIIGLIIGVLILIGNAVQGDPDSYHVPTTTNSDGPQFKQWLCDNGSLPSSECSSAP